MDSRILILIALCIALAVHYIGQKQLLIKGLELSDPSIQIKRLMINGSTLLVFSGIAIFGAQHPFNFFGILIFIEGAVCLAFARKLKSK